MAFLRRKMFFEAEGDENEGNAEGANASNATDNTADQGNNAENNNDQNNDNGDQDNADSNDNDDDAEKDNADDEDYSIDSDMDDDEDDNNDSSDDSGDDDSSDTDTDSEDDTPDSSEDNEEKQLDRDMFSTLSEDEQKRKIATLKRLYIDLYSKADALIEKFNQVGSLDDEEFGPIAKRILNILYEMKEYVSYYVLNIYDNSSYIENDITFNRYLSILDGVKLCVEELDKQKEEENGKK